MRHSRSRFKASAFVRGRTLAFALSLLVSPMSLADEPILVAPSLEVGAQWRCSVSMDVLVSRATDAQETLTRTVQSARLTLKAMRSSADGSIVVQGRFDRLTAVWRRGDTQYEFTYVRPADEKNAEAAPAEPTPDVGGAKLADVKIVPPAGDGEAKKPTDAQVFKTAYGMLASRPFEIVVSAAGVVTDVVGMTKPLRVLATREGLDSSAFGMFLPPKFAQALGPIWSAAGARVVEETGDTWEQNRQVDLGPAGSIGLTTAWIADEQKRQMLTCSGELDASISVPDRISAAQPQIDITQASGTTFLAWSLADQELVKWKEDLTLSTKWRVGDVAIALTQFSKRRLERLD